MAAKKESKKEKTKKQVEPVKTKKGKVADTDNEKNVVVSDHGEYYTNVRVDCVCGNSFTINTTIPGPIKVETCYACHPAYNKSRVVKKVIKGRMEKFLERQKKIDAKR